MNKAKQLTIIISVLIVVSLIGIASAQTFIIGKTYNSDFTGIIEGVDLIVTCGGNTLATTSLNDGTYAVGFEVSACNDTDAVSVSADKGSLSGSNTGTLKIDNESFDYFAVVNIKMSEVSSPPSSSGGSHGNTWYYYNCGNNVCDTGESINTCPEDCDLDFEALSTDNKDINNSNEKIDLTELKEGQKEDSSGITGGFIGALKTKTGIGLIFAIIIIALGIGVLSLRKRR
ncbi:hypothetical protein BMS3Abin17_01216 [archaeon BMS3Abin17]|nr:hypothetical protein BMS3Abin17_01216 [archaeon BMS3Abin17]HDZ61008.1 hypothetical protein [Candidatus Pacearchaeota archaeon]